MERNRGRENIYLGKVIIREYTDNYYLCSIVSSFKLYRKDVLYR